jgi:hypothetical protein
MKRNLLEYSLWLSIISIVATLIINFKISQDYFGSAGKDRAFFSLSAVINYLYQYYIAILGLVSLILVLFSKVEQNQLKKKFAIGFLAVFSIILVFVKVWVLFVWLGN